MRKRMFRDACCCASSTNRTRICNAFALRSTVRDYKRRCRLVRPCANDLNDKLEHYTQNDFFKGLRHIVQDEEDDFFMLRDDFQQGISQLQRFDLTYDILIYPRQFEAAIALTQNFPDQYFVLDHLGKTSIQSSDGYALGRTN